MKKRALSLMTVVGITVSLVVAAVLYAANMPEVMVLDSPYEKTRSAVTFTHQKHIDDYNIGCGECHHDEKGKPLTDLQAGDPVEKCIDCHSKPGEIRGREAQALTEAQRLEYHANAMHANCVDCHREYNREKGERVAPATCVECHPR